MSKYQVVLEKTTYYSLDVEADSIESAAAIAQVAPVEEFAENNTEYYYQEPVEIFW